MAKKQAKQNAIDKWPHGRRGEHRPTKGRSGAPKASKNTVITEETIRVAGNLWALGATNSQVKDHLMETLGAALSPTRFNELRTRVRARASAYHARDPKQTLQEALERYTAILEASDSTYKDKLYAQQRIDELLGHEYKWTAQKQSSTELTDKLRQALRAMEEDET